MKIGIDIGGSHISLGTVDEYGNIEEKIEKNIIKDKIITEEIEQFIIKNTVDILLKEKIDQIGIAFPGTISNNKIIKSVNLEIENYDLAEKLEKILGIKVQIKNDAKCAALAEQKYGELGQYKNSLFLCIGTGVGGAIIFNNNLLEPSNVPGFEISHMIIQKNGTFCNCGKRGCFETYASIKRFKEKIACEFNLHTIDGIEIKKFIMQNKDNITLRYLINNYIEDLSIGISNLINIFEPEVICIGGSFAYFEDMFIKPLTDKLLQGNLLFNKRCDIIIKLAKLKNDAGIIGATLI